MSELRERRRAPRVRIGIELRQFVDDESHACVTTDLSACGLFLEHRELQLHRRSNVVQLEMTLPGVSESLWAKGTIVYDAVGALSHGSAVELTMMARRHRVLLEDWVRKVAAAA